MNNDSDNDLHSPQDPEMMNENNSRPWEEALVIKKHEKVE